MLNQLIAYFEDRYTELMRLSGIDDSKSIDWYDGGLAEVKRSLAYLKKHASQPNTSADGDEQCPKCGSDLGHYPNCPDGICFISRR